jgi:methionyl-tRNA synthetase
MTISLNDFKKIDLRVATILEVEDIEGKDRLFKLKIDLGSEQRTIVAGIKQCYSKEELKGKQIIVVANLEPAKIAGIVSNGMLLAIGTPENLSLLTTDKPRKPGEKVE